MAATTHTFHLAPRDLLFLRGARPMEASDAGLGANWPRPDQLWNALANAFRHHWPEHQPWEHPHRRNDTDTNEDSSFRFGALKTAGPFPFATRDASDHQGDLLFRAGLYLPCPLDLSADQEGRLHPMRLMPSRGSDLPRPLTHVFASSRIGKREPPAWLHGVEYAAYLAGKAVNPARAELYGAEHHIGVAIDATTRAATEGRLYQAEYLRLHHDVRLAFCASCEIVGAGRQTADVLAEGPFRQACFDVVMGGQQGLAKALRTTQAVDLPTSRIEGNGLLLKWVLLSPAVFPAIEANAMAGIEAHPGGWLPTWVAPGSGQVMLPRQGTQRLPGEPRDAWRQRVKQAPRFAARLIAARVGKPLPFSGWDLQTGPKPTVLAVPAGSVYVFHCRDHAELADLASALSWNGSGGREPRNRRSTLFGEKGFGLGVCCSSSPRGTESLPH